MYQVWFCFLGFSLSFAFLRYVGFSLKTVNAAEG